MAITKIKIANFKSFEALEVDLRPLNIVVGGNAAGKSNFLEVFRFLRDLAAHGLEDAVSLQGGMEYLVNLKIGRKRPVILEVTFDFELSIPVGARRLGFVFGKVFQSTYRLSFRSSRKGFELETLTDELVHRCRFESVEEELGEGEILFSGEGEVLRSEITSSETLDALGASLFPSVQEKSLQSIILGSGSEMLSNLTDDVSVFDFDPKLSKKASPVTGLTSLESDGSNLAIVLRNIMQDKKQAEVFVRILKDALPFVDNLRVDKFADKSLLISLRERFAVQSYYLPAPFLSDGTLHLAALILALYFDKAALTIIEEPERNIHPHLISKVVAMMQEASGKKQIIATTHNPDVVKNASLEDLLFVRRDSRGFSRIERPAENEELKVFLENDLGVDELYVQNLLDVGYGV